MPCAPLLRFGGVGEDSRTEAGEVMSGVLEVVRGSNLSSSMPNYNRLTTAGCSSSSYATNCQRVFVRVYRTSSEHFAVLYPIRAIVTACRPLASLNLRSCCVKPLPGTGREFRVSPRACEGVAVTFRALEGSSENQMADWLQAFTDVQDGVQRRKKISDHRSPLPVLEESEEDVEEEQPLSAGV